MKKENYGNWVTKQIPIAQAIIGLKGNYGSSNAYITSLGFIMWTPKETESPQKIKRNESFLLIPSPLKKFLSD